MTQELVLRQETYRRADIATERILESLRYPEMDARKNAIRENHPETFRWAFERRPGLPGVEDTTTTELVAWLQSDAQVFWISGKPGSGKSTLMRYIVMNPSTKEHFESWRSDVLVLCHYFWKPVGELQRNVEGMLCSLLFQLLCKDHRLIHCLVGKIEDIALKRKVWDWATGDLNRALLVLLDASSRPTCLFLDGLDEAQDHLLWLEPPDDGPCLLERLVGNGKVKICLSSREEPVFCEHFQNVPRMTIHELTEVDIRRLAERRLAQSPSLDNNTWKSLIYELVGKASGVFLWLILALDSLNRGIRHGDSPQLLLERLKLLPQDLENLLSDMWERHGSDMRLYRESASLLFSLITVCGDFKALACTSLPVIALASDEVAIEACIRDGPPRATTVPAVQGLTDRTKTAIRNHCASLLEVHGSMGSPSFVEDTGLPDYGHLAFIHRSVHDFLAETDKGRQLRDACGVSRNEITKSIITAIMICGGLPCPSAECNPHIPPDLVVTRFGYQREFPLAVNRVYALSVLKRGIEKEFLTAFTADELFKLAQDWQIAGFFQDYTYWQPPSSRHWMQPRSVRQVEFISALLNSDNVSYAAAMLFSLDERDFLAAVPGVVTSWSRMWRSTTALIHRIFRQLELSMAMNDPMKAELLIHLFNSALDLFPTVGERLEHDALECFRSEMDQILLCAERLWPDSHPLTDGLAAMILFSVSNTGYVQRGNWRANCELQKSYRLLIAAVNHSWLLRHASAHPGSPKVPQSLLQACPSFELLLVSGADPNAATGSFTTVGEQDGEVLGELVERLLTRSHPWTNDKTTQEFAEARDSAWKRGQYVGGWEDALEYLYQMGYALHPWEDGWYDVAEPRQLAERGQKCK